MNVEQIRARLEELVQEHFPEENLDWEKIKIEISNRLRTTAGKVIYWPDGSKTLRLSKRYHDRFGWGRELDETLKHELVHLLGVRGHGFRFQKIARRIGAERYCKAPNDRPTEIIYECRACGFTFSSVNYEDFCPKCGDLVSEIGELEI